MNGSTSLQTPAIRAYARAEQSHQRADALARALIAQALAYCTANEVQALTRVREHLMVLVDDRPSLGTGQNLRSAHQLLGRYGERFNRAFQRKLVENISEELGDILPRPQRPSAAVPLSDTGLDGLSLSLIDVDEVERVLLIDRIAQRFSSRFDAQLEPLTQRLSVLFGRERQSIHDNPFQPAVLLRAFHGAWVQCELDPQATDDLMQSLDPGHWFDLGTLYDELNQTLVRAGVPAQRPLRVRQSGYVPLQGAQSGSPSQSGELRGADGASTSAYAPLDSGAQAAAASGWAGLAPAARTVAAHARQFLQRLGLISGGASVPGGGASADAQRLPEQAASPALMGYLGTLQAGAGAQAAPTWSEGDSFDDYNVLRQMREHDEVRRAPDLDRGTVDALAEVFDFVFADQAIPMQMKVIIGRLQIPVLRAAMMDRDFFLSDQHPARRLVDTLASASVAWTPEKGETDPLYVRIEHTVQRVLTEFEDDLNLFAELLREFTEFLFETEQQAQARVEPVARLEHSVEAREQAQSRADELIAARLAALSVSQTITPFLLPFLTVQWRDVLAHALLDAPDAADAGQRELAVLDQLVWSTQPKTTGDDRKSLVAVLPEMVRQLNLGLDQIDWNGKPRAVFTRRLISVHTMAIRLTQAAPLDTGSAALEIEQGQEAMNQLDARRAARQQLVSEDAFDTQAQALARGMWFEVEVEGSRQVRCRLSWVSPMRTRLLFTNREGVDAFVRSEREVAAMLRMGRMRVLDQDAIVGRALDKVLADSQEALAA